MKDNLIWQNYVRYKGEARRGQLARKKSAIIQACAGQALKSMSRE